jgi:hypothetical protein
MSDIDQAWQALFEIFSKSAVRSGRTYVLELVNGAPVFSREEVDLLIDNAILEIYGPPDEDRGDNIVPEKLAKRFPVRRS